MADNKNTQYFKVNNETDIAVKDILEAVYICLLYTSDAADEL